MGEQKTVSPLKRRATTRLCLPTILWICKASDKNLCDVVKTTNRYARASFSPRNTLIYWSFRFSYSCNSDTATRFPMPRSPDADCKPYQCPPRAAQKLTRHQRTARLGYSFRAVVLT
jgi:hypothetical protein